MLKEWFFQPSFTISWRFGGRLSGNLTGIAYSPIFSNMLKGGGKILSWITRSSSDSYFALKIVNFARYPLKTMKYKNGIAMRRITLSPLSPRLRSTVVFLNVDMFYWRPLSDCQCRLSLRQKLSEAHLFVQVFNNSLSDDVKLSIGIVRLAKVENSYWKSQEKALPLISWFDFLFL